MIAQRGELEKLGVPEALRLDPQGKYRSRKGSLELPRFPLAAASALLLERKGRSDTPVIRAFIKALS